MKFQIFFTIPVSFLLTVCYFSASAQPQSNTDYYNSVKYQNERARERDALRRNEKSAENNSRPNTPSSSGSQYRWEKNRQAAADKERYAKDAATKEADKAAAAKYAEADRIRIAEAERSNEELRKREAAAAIVRRNEQAAILVRESKVRNEFLEQSAKENNGLLTDDDRRDREEDMIYAWHNDLKYEKKWTTKWAVESYNEKKNTGSYEELIKFANAASEHARFATAAYNQILTRFPEHRQEIELATLAAMPYYFGGRRPYLPKIDNNFPTHSIYETAEEGEKLRLLAAFDALATKYPKEALIAAGKCRIGQNPFLQLANRAEDNEQKCVDYHWRVLRSDYSNTLPADFKKYKSSAESEASEQYVTTALQPSGRYLMKHRRAELKAISREDWANMVELSGLHKLTFTHTFHSPQYKEKDAIAKYGEWGFIWKILPKLWKSDR